MKGHTTIILTDVNTGKQEVHEDENLITNALDKIINIEMAMNHAPNTRILPVATNLLGGIMLFDGQLTEDAGNIYFPTEAHLVGYAAQSVNTTDKYRGSYNAIESGKTSNGYVSVWDFGTTQANGSIKAVARTHNQAGACPMIYFNGPERETTANGAPNADTGWHPIRYDGEYVYMLKPNTDTHIMRLAKAKIPTMRMGVADYSDVSRQYEVIASWDTHLTAYEYYTNSAHTQTNTVDVYADAVDLYEDGGDGYIYCVAYDPTSHVYGNIYDYNISYFTIKYAPDVDEETGVSSVSYEKSATRRITVGVTGYRGYRYSDMYWAERQYGHVRNGVLYMLASNRKAIYKIPLDNPASYLATRIIGESDSDYIEHLHWICGHEGIIYFEVYHYTLNSYNHLHGMLYPDGVYLVTEVSYNQYARLNNTATLTECRTRDDDLTVWGYYDGERLCRNWAANYLGTINNLSSEIIKTAAQTMKIIYTLTDIDE